MTVIRNERSEYDIITDRAEDHMRAGRWDEAEADLRRVCDGADLNLRLIQLGERKDCVGFLAEQHDLGTRFQAVHTLLYSRYDRFTAEWALSEYRGK